MKNAYTEDKFSSVSYYIYIHKTVHIQELKLKKKTFTGKET